MSTSQLPVRPSLDSLRKQARKLARDIAAGDAGAIARARACLPRAALPISHRDAQLVLAREYGFAGWKELVKEVQQRLGSGLAWAAAEARRLIHDNDTEGLRRLLAEYPALLSWSGDADGRGLLGMATGSFGDSFDPVSEQHFTRPTCAEMLLDAGAVVVPSVCDGLIASRSRTLIDLFQRRGLLPRSLKFLAALGDPQGVRTRLADNADGPAQVNEAFFYACHLRHATVAALLLDRSLALDPEMADRIDSGPGRAALIQDFIAHKPDVHDADPFIPWQAFVARRVERALHDGALTAFVDGLRREAWLLSVAQVKFQVRLVEGAILNDRAAFLEALLDLDPAFLHCPVPPPSHGFVHAFTYGRAYLVPILLRIWHLPDDLPHAAGNGDFARVRSWFDAAGKPALGELAHHFPANDAWIRGNLNWGAPKVQQVLDTAFAWAVMNNRFAIAAFLLDHGADVNTDWSSHEPASVLHELVWHKNYEAMQFLIDRGIDMTIRDYRWDATAEGWAAVAAKDEKMAQWLREAQQRREPGLQAR